MCQTGSFIDIWIDLCVILSSSVLNSLITNCCFTNASLTEASITSCSLKNVSMSNVYIENLSALYMSVSMFSCNTASLITELQSLIYNLNFSLNPV